MGNAFRLAAGVGAIVIAAVVAINLLPAGGVGGPPGPSPTPTPTPMPLATASEPSPIAAGTYVSDPEFLVRATVTVPAGWEGNTGGPYAVWLQPAVGSSQVGITIFSKVYADACHVEKGLLTPLPGSSVDALSSALASLPGLSVTAPTDTTLAGYPARQLMLTAPTSVAGCTLAPGGVFRVWELPLGATNDLAPGAVERVWILEVGGQRVVISVVEAPGESAKVKAEIQAVIDSIQLAPHN